MTVSPPSPPLRGLRALFANRGYRFALSWVVLVVMFVVFFQWFGRGSDQAGTVVPGPLRVLSSYFFLLPVAGVFGFLYLRMRRACAVNNRGLALMADGDLAGAAALYRRLARQWLGPRVVAHVNLGLVLLRLGDPRGAADAFAAIERKRGEAARLLKPMGASYLALCAALIGDLDSAQVWAEEARRRAANPSAVSRGHLVAEAVIRCRRSDSSGAARLLQERWGEIERSVTADFVRAFRVIRAFAIDTAGAPDCGSATDLIAGARPARSGEYVWLGAGWPEMAGYLASKGIA